jgi:GT2 family glycosyltransferase
MSGEEPLDLSIVLVNWNALEHLRRAVASLRERVHSIAYEVIIVDNASTRDESRSALEREFPGASVILNAENRGFGAACNQGIALARGRYVLLLNTDTLQIEDAPGKAVRYLDERPELGVVGVRHLNDDAERAEQASTFDFPDAYRYLRGMLKLAGPADRRAHPSYETDVDCVCGSFLMIRRECWEEIGGLDERYFVYEEDADWCLRAWQAGWRVRYWPGASIVHRGATAREFLSDKSFMHHRSLLTFFHKNRGSTEALVFYGVVTLALSAGTLRQATNLLFGRGDGKAFAERVRRQWLFMTVRHWRHGISAG